MTERKPPRILDQVGENFADAIARQSASAGGRSSRRRRVSVALAVAAAIVAIAVGGTAILSGGAPSVSEAAASLQAAAYATDPPPADSYAYTLSTISIVHPVVAGTRPSRLADPGTLARVTQRREAWLSVRRPGRLSVSQRTYVGGSSLDDSEAGQVRPLGDYRIGAATYSPAQLQQLEAEPEQAVRDVTRAVEKAPQSEQAELRWRLTLEPLQLFAPVLPANVRAALIGSLTSIEGIAVKETEAESRKSFTLRSSGLEYAVSFSTDTATLVSSSTTVRRAGAGPFAITPPGTVVIAFELKKSGTSSRAGSPPR